MPKRIVKTTIYESEVEMAKLDPRLKKHPKSKLGFTFDQLFHVVPDPDPAIEQRKLEARERAKERRRNRRAEKKKEAEDAKKLQIYDEIVSTGAVPTHMVMELHKNKIGARDALVTAFEEIGGVQALVEWAKSNKKEFYLQLWSKLIPRENTLDVGDNLEALLSQLGGGKPPSITEQPDMALLEAEFTEVEEDAAHE